MLAISVGHHENAKGAIYKHYNEYELALLWSSLICRHLTKKFVVVSGLLRNKTKRINVLGCSMALEIHFNSELTKKAAGHEVLYYPGSSKGKMFADKINTVLSGYFKPDRGIKEGYYKLNKNNGVNFFLSNTKCPSIIIEPEFIFNIDEINKQDVACCKAIAICLNELIL